MIKENLNRIKENIESVCKRFNRSPSEITTVAVTKTATLDNIKEIIDLGIQDIGENRLQEAILKFNRLSTIEYRPSTIKWHMVGHLQRNKVKEAVKVFDLVHSVDSLRLAEELDKQADKINKIQDILVQVNTSLEATKFGINPEETIEVIKQIVKLKNLNLRGLMTIAPLVNNPEDARPCFKKLRDLMDEINRPSIIDTRLSVLSMGMTDDYEVAIEEGATMIRLGRAIFK